ncbi:MAG: hypothetical protein HY774_02975 [Acidobacteria bacterium]|nr:hypothetical protein [Acidobacteriota bacterium]
MVPITDLYLDHHYCLETAILCGIAAEIQALTNFFREENIFDCRIASFFHNSCYEI